MEITPLNLGSHIATATAKLVKDQQVQQGQAVLALIESAGQVQANAAASQAPASTSSQGIDVYV